MRSLLFTITLVLLGLTSLAQPNPPAGTYLQDLRTWLKSNWYDGYFSDLGYNGAREQMYGFVDANNGMTECVYTGFQQAAEFVTFPNPINAEHLVPQSFFGSASPMRSDLHNLRPAHGSANSARANYPFGEVPDANAFWYGVTINGDYFSTTVEPGNSDEFSEREGSLWEPREEYKGDIARELFYFYTMYPTQAGDISLVADINVLYQWHLDDPASAEEMTRNNRAETVQGNRNPYIDFTDLVYNAWFWVEVLGCTDPEASNYDINANTDDGSCEYIVVVPGCIYEAAANYNPLATVDDGSCVFDPGVLGCTYPSAENYDPTATVDDGSCTYDQGIPGCTYADADNYDMNATLDDGSCIFINSVSCEADVNGDNIVNATDLLIVLGGFGAPCN
ncbi:endonuclease I family protein [Sanyastnella coralliicola]|uniref:endonuclease I family protein n=1 Tax=Sanyastnella coralliicola TaxID=3069118 RepID=UPI0027BA07A5|nr:endonuclease [Longitalea sp. SCSIO 12813]